MNYRMIDKIDNLELEKLTFEDVNKHFGTGRAFTEGTGKNKRTLYRHGIATNVGDISEDVWCETVKALIARNNEQHIFSALRKYVSEKLPWVKEKEVEIEALSRHASRIFENRNWRDYDLFIGRYLNQAENSDSVANPNLSVLEEWVVHRIQNDIIDGEYYYEQFESLSKSKADEILESIKKKVFSKVTETYGTENLKNAWDKLGNDDTADAIDDYITNCVIECFENMLIGTGGECK